MSFTALRHNPVGYDPFIIDYYGANVSFIQTAPPRPTHCIFGDAKAVDTAPADALADNFDIGTQECPICHETGWTSELELEQHAEACLNLNMNTFRDSPQRKESIQDSACALRTFAKAGALPSHCQEVDEDVSLRLAKTESVYSLLDEGRQVVATSIVCENFDAIAHAVSKREQEHFDEVRRSMTDSNYAVSRIEALQQDCKKPKK